MTALIDQHRRFAAALRRPESAAPALFRNSDSIPLERRFAVHRNTFVVSLIDALTDAFPVTCALVGTEFFRAMARQRVLADPPRSPILTEYTFDFPEFIAHFAPAATVPYLADVARIEALRIRAYHAADAVPVPEASYRKLLADPERMSQTRLTLHPACLWLHSRHAAYSIWHAHQTPDDPAQASLERLDIERGEDTLIARPGLEVTTSRLPDGAIAWLDALGRRRTLHQAQTMAQAASASTEIGALFTLLIQHGLVIAFDMPPEMN